MTIEQDAAGFELDGIVEFLEVDLTEFGGNIYRVYNSIDLGETAGVVSFLGVDWDPVPYTSEGWGVSGSGATPRPTITVGDFDGILLANAVEYNDLIGARVRRFETTYDNIATNSYYGPEIWLINQKIESDGYMMKIGLAAPMDQKSKKLPASKMWRDEYPALGRNRY